MLIALACSKRSPVVIVTTSGLLRKLENTVSSCDDCYFWIFPGEISGALVGVLVSIILQRDLKDIKSADCLRF